ncbi:addiction module antidote protein [Endothiovibrio diazotrophicus]
MTEKIRIADLPEFDIIEYLEDGQAIAEYLTIVLEEDDSALLAAAMGDVARARGMTKIAKACGVARE